MFTMAELTKILACSPQGAGGGDLTEQRGDLELSGICTDTRKLQAGEAFLTLKGPRFDGNDYLAAAAGKGASALIADDPNALEKLREEGTAVAGLPVFLVEDALAAYEKLAAAYRQKLKGKVVAITGSVGKTGTRDMIAAGLSQSFRTQKTKANLNNNIGLAQTILSADPEVGALVVEAGIDGPGQMAPLAEMAAPDIAVITMVGLSHIEQFSDREALIREKAVLADGVRVGGWLLLNGNDEATETIVDLAPHCRIGLVAVSDDRLGAGFPVGHILFRAADVKVDSGGTAFSVFAHESAGKEGLHLGRIEIPAIGRHHVTNALFACLCAFLLGADFAAVAAGLGQFEPTGNRQRIEQIGDIRIVNDTYNASQESMQAAFDLTSVLVGKGERFIAVLSGINELGSLADQVHREVGAALASHRPAAVFLLGERAPAIAAGFEAAEAAQPGVASKTSSASSEQEVPVKTPVWLFDDQVELIKALESCVRAGDVILVKGSRGYHMEAVCEAVRTFIESGVGEVEAQVEKGVDHV